MTTRSAAGELTRRTSPRVGGRLLAMATLCGSRTGAGPLTSDNQRLGMIADVSL
jgi:hypothetical protein